MRPVKVYDSTEARAALWAQLEEIEETIRNTSDDLERGRLIEKRDLFRAQYDEEIEGLERLIAAPALTPSAGDTGGCSICPKRQTLTIQLDPLIRQDVAAVQVQLDTQTFMLGPSTLALLHNTGRAEMVLPATTAGALASVPRANALLVKIFRTSTRRWYPMERLEDCALSKLD